MYMTRTLGNMAAAVLMLVAISSCEEDTLNIGQTLTDSSDELEMNTATYDVSTRTIMADSVLSLSADCYFGRVRDPETGADVTSEFTTQFHLLEDTYISGESNIVGRYNGRAAADSCDIILYIQSPFRAADSLAAMKMRVSELAKPMEEGQRYYSNFSPVAAGMVRQGGISQQQMFTYANLGATDKERRSDSYFNCIRIPLNSPYTAKDGTVYKNYGTYIMHQYYDHPELFRNSYVFTHELCPGFLFQISDGLGFHAEVSNIGLRTFYTVKSDTATTSSQLVMAGTREVLQTTHVVNNRQALLAMAAETQYTYLKTPAGLFTEVTLPVIAIKQGHDSDSLLAAKLTFQRLNNQSNDPRVLGIPQTLLMVQKDSLHNFFEKDRVPDNVTSYYTGYNNPIPTTTTYYQNDNTYTFNNLSSLITFLWQKRKEGLKNDADWEAHHPDWNKMVLVPVASTKSSSGSGIVGIQHDMSLPSTRLVGGPDNPNEPIRISIVYAKFK